MLIMASSNPNQSSAPININMRRPSQSQANASRLGRHNRFELGPPSLHDRSGFDSAAAAATTPAPSSSDATCQSCRHLGFICIVNRDSDCCTTCLDAGAECSFLALSPQSRKRKMHSEAGGESTVKRGFSMTDLHSRRNPNSNFSHDVTNAALIEDLANVGGPTSLSRTLGLQLNRHSQYIGHTTDFEPTLLSLSSKDPQNESISSRGALRKVQDGTSFLLIPDSTTRGYEQQEQDTMAVEALVAPHGRKLIDLFFRIVHPSFPICQKYVFIEKYERDYREFAPPLLATVYLLAINWWNHSQELASLPRPNTNALEKLVRSSLADSMCRPKLSTVEAALLLAQIPGCSQWTSTAQLVAMGQELGLHLDCSNWDIPPWEKGMRKRLSWGLYLQDKWGSLIHGRPSHISPSNWAVRTLTINDFPDVDWVEGNMEERDDCETGRVIFMRFVQLTAILTEILDTFYSLVAMQKIENAGAQGAQMVLAQAKPIQLKLKEWYAGLPACVRLESLSSGGRPLTRPSSVGYLHLAYFAAEITLHRRIIGSFDASPTTVDPYLEHICRSAAKARLISSMDFVNRLSPNHLHSFWYFASKTSFALIGTFGSLLWATSPAREEADWYRRRLAEYRWTLSVCGKPGQGHYLTGFAMDMLDTSTGLLLRQLPEKPLSSSSAVVSRSTSALDFAGRSLPSSFSGFGSGSGSGVGGFSLQGSLSTFGSTLDRNSLHSLESEDESSDEDDDLEDD